MKGKEMYINRSVCIGIGKWTYMNIERDVYSCEKEYKTSSVQNTDRQTNRQEIIQT